MSSSIKKMAENKIAKKLLCLSSSIFLLSGQLAPVAYAASEGNDILNLASDEDIGVLKSAYQNKQTTLPLPTALLSKNFSLNKYEVLVMSELIKEDISSRIKNESEKADALRDLIDLQNKYQSEYRAIFNKLPEEIISQADAVRNSEDYASAGPADDNSIDITGLVNDAIAKKTAGGNPSNESSSDNSGKVNSPQTVGQMVDGFKKNIENSSSPEDLADNMSLINVRKDPSQSVDEDALPTAVIAHSPNPVMDFQNEQDVSRISPRSEAIPGTDTSFSKAEKDEWADLVSMEAERSVKKAKHFFLTMEHNLYYVDEHGKGQILDTSRKDDLGKDYQSDYVDQYQLEESIEIGLGIRVHKALDMVVSMIAKNEDGSVFSDGTTWEFGNVMFKFHPERLSKGELKKLDTKGIIIRNGGRFVGKRLGHSVVVGTDTENGRTQIEANNGAIVASYDHDDGFEFTSQQDKYFLGIGKLSLDFSSYTLQLSDCKAVEVGYRDNNETLTLIYGKPVSSSEGTTTYDTNNKPVLNKGIFDKFVTAAQYTTRKLIPNIEMAFNFAQANDRGSLTSPNGATNGKTTVYSVVVKSDKLKNTSFEGEFAHSINNYDTSKDKTVSGNSDFLDITHQFNKKLGGTLHLINIDGSYDASSLVEDKTGDSLYTTNTGDGLADYLYEIGQRGLDLTLNYTFGSNTSLALGYSRYTKTTSLNDKTNYYASLDRSWSFSDANGGRNQSLNWQSRYEYAHVRPHKVGGTEQEETAYINTVSYSGEPWENGDVQMDYQRQIDDYEGNETNFDMSVAHHFYPLERVTITPKSEYVRKKGSPGYDSTAAPEDVTELINTLTMGYEIVPDELTVNVLFAKEKYNVISSEIKESTGEKVDGEKRDVTGAGIGLIWEPKRIDGLSVGVSYRRDKVHYYTNGGDNSNQDVWDYNVSYDKALSDNIRASISYDYNTIRDKIKPIYNETTRTVQASIYADINGTQSIKLEHNYTFKAKPLDPNANYKESTTILTMSNKF